MAEGKPYNTFLDDLKDKCLGKLINSPMKNSKSDDEIIIELQKKLILDTEFQKGGFSINYLESKFKQ